jgi:hypothetical protein
MSAVDSTEFSVFLHHCMQDDELLFCIQGFGEKLAFELQ